jgi:hypothetical protein
MCYNGSCSNKNNGGDEMTQLDEAKRHDQEARDSFERCDTDGFVSQWAHGLTAQKARLQAEIDENGGVYPFEVLIDADGHRKVDAKLIDGRYGACWLLSDEEETQFGRRFIPFAGDGGKSRIQKQLGLYEDFEDAPAKAIITGKGTGLSGSAWVIAIKIDAA